MKIISYNLKITLLIAFLVTLLFKPTWLFNNGTLEDEVDDLSYWLHAATLAFDYDIDYLDDFDLSNDTINPITNAPYHAPGAGYLSAPFVFLFSYLDEGNIIRSNPVKTFSYAGFFAATLFYCYFGLYFINNIETNIDKFNKRLVLIITLLSTLVHFVATRFLMSHVVEFFLVSLLVYLFEKNNNHDFSKDIYKIFILYFLLSITRPSTFVISLFFFLIYKVRFKYKNFLIPKLSSFVIVLSYLYLYISNTLYKENSIGLNLSTNNTTSGYLSYFNIERVFDGLLSIPNILFSPSMGILWSTPVIFFGIITFLKKNNNPHIRNSFAWVYILSFFLILFIWQGNEVSYGQRLLIGLIPFMSARLIKLSNKIFYRRSMVFSCLITYIGYLYFYSSQNLTLKEGKNLYGHVTKWSAEDYYINLIYEIFNIENIFSLLSRTIYSTNFFKFTSFDKISNFVNNYFVLSSEKISRLESYVSDYSEISTGYFFLVTSLILLFSYLVANLSNR